MFRAVIFAGVLSVATMLSPAAVLAEATPITVRVISKDAKFIGSSMGGVQVVITDAASGRILAEGFTRGGTGDTGRIMKTAHTRPTRLATPDAAKFEAVIDIDRPTHVKVTATGPVAQQQAANTVSATQWVLPGRGVAAGDAWLLEMPGMVVDVLSPPTHIKYGENPGTVPLTANVTMMCGCPLQPDGVPWDSDNYEVTAHVLRNGTAVEDVPLTYAGRTSQFSAAVQTAGKPGVYEVIVSAYDPRNGNTGIDRVTFVVP